jgi:hypothetical protein
VSRKKDNAKAKEGGGMRKSRIALWVMAAALAVGIPFGMRPAIAAVASPASPASALRSSFSPNECGPWSAEGTATTKAIAAKHGPIRNCMRFGGTWVIATSGGRSVPGAIGVLSCDARTACLDGWNNPGIGRMRWLKPAGLSGGSTVLGVDGRNLIIDYAGHQLMFNLVSDQFSTGGK